MRLLAGPNETRGVETTLKPQAHVLKLELEQQLGLAALLFDRRIPPPWGGNLSDWGEEEEI